MVLRASVRVHLPLQQGLRRLHKSVPSLHQCGASASSITTRIKTILSFSISLFFMCASASSITTRIKTFNFLAFYVAFDDGASASSITTRIKTPLMVKFSGNVKRGASASSITTRIKTVGENTHVTIDACASASSITTRIKTGALFPSVTYGMQVRVHLPLQQGLRQRWLPSRSS